MLQGYIGSDAEIIPRRRSAKIRHSNQDYLPCAICKGFFLKSELWRHHRRCSQLEEESDRENERDYKVSVTAEAKILLSSAFLSASKDLNNYVCIYIKYFYDMFLYKSDLYRRFTTENFSI